MVFWLIIVNLPNTYKSFLVPLPVLLLSGANSSDDFDSLDSDEDSDSGIAYVMQFMLIVSIKAITNKQHTRNAIFFY